MKFFFVGWSCRPLHAPCLAAASPTTKDGRTRPEFQRKEEPRPSVGNSVVVWRAQKSDSGVCTLCTLWASDRVV